MKLQRLFGSITLSIMIIVWISSAILTVIPDSTASKVCYLSYYAHCSFTPFGTIISIVAAGITYIIARKLNYMKF